MKESVKRKEPKRYRLNNISIREIKNKYPDKVIDAYAEHGRLVIVLDTCKIKFDERVKQKLNNIYGTTHSGKLVDTS